MQGAEQVHRSDLNALKIFLKPPSMEELERRLRSRGTESEESISTRLEAAAKEMEFAESSGVFDHVLVNDEVPSPLAFFPSCTRSICLEHITKRDGSVDPI